MEKRQKRETGYLRRHPFFNAITNLSVGIGIGIIITYPYVQAHPLRFGLVFLGIGLLGYLYAIMAGK